MSAKNKLRVYKTIVIKNKAFKNALNLIIIVNGYGI